MPWLSSCCRICTVLSPIVALVMIFSLLYLVCDNTINQTFNKKITDIYIIIQC